MTETGRLQPRLRLLPSPRGVNFVLALSLFPHPGMALQTFAHSLEGGARALTSRHRGAPPKAD
nr:transposase domain-containing protein [Streptomyces sp. NBRC 110028]